MYELYEPMQPPAQKVRKTQSWIRTHYRANQSAEHKICTRPTNLHSTLDHVCHELLYRTCETYKHLHKMQKDVQTYNITNLCWVTIQPTWNPITNLPNLPESYHEACIKLITTSIEAATPHVKPACLYDHLSQEILWKTDFHPNSALWSTEIWKCFFYSQGTN